MVTSSSRSAASTAPSAWSCLLQALAADSSLRCVIAGEGPDRERLEQLLFDGRNDSAAELIERLDRSLLDFQDSEQRDDIAVLALRRVD